MSILLTTFDQVASNPSNKSPAKALYSFTKEERFRQMN